MLFSNLQRFAQFLERRLSLGSLQDDLKAEIAKGRVVAIVGAGVSIAVTEGDPLASWTGLLQNGVDRCVERCQPLPAGWEDRRRGEIATGDIDELLSAAENVARKLGAPGGGDYRAWLRETVGSLEAKDTSLLDALRELEVILATTNYDGLLEGPRLPAVTWRDGARMERVVRGDDPGVLHLHGYWQQPESVILGIRSYEAVLGDVHAQALQQALRMTRTFLFVGCGEGLADPNFRALREWSRNVFKDSEYRHFRLCRDSELASLRKEHPRTERIIPLSYGAKFSELPKYLRGLKSRRPSRSVRPTAKLSGKPRLPGLRNCFGREEEIRQLVDSLCADPPPPVPVLGQAGIGKSTVVTAALHDPRVKARYGERRYFVRADGATDRESLVGEIARGLGLQDGSDSEARLFEILEQSALVLALDDAETSYWAETEAVEDLLSQLAAVPGLALVISLRGEQRPLGPRWREAIRLRPLLPTPAREAFLAVAGERFRHDPVLDRLLAAVDGWPLALTLLAHRAEMEHDLSSLWELWAAKRTELLRSVDDKSRLNIDVCLELSINSPRMTEDSRRLLSLLGVLPEGIVRDRLKAFFPQAQQALSAAAVLRQVGLALDEEGRIRSLAPVRDYVREKHPVTRDDLQRAVRFYLQWAQETLESLKANARELTQPMAQEFGNLEALVIASLTPPVADLDSTDDASEIIRSILSLGSLLLYTGLGQRASVIVGRALQRAEDIGDAQLRIDCLILLGDIARVHANWEEARRHFAASVALSRESGNRFLEAVGISQLGAVEQGFSQLAAARRYYEEANGLFAGMGMTDEQGRCLLDLAKVHFEGRELALAEAKARESLDLFSRTGNELGTANGLHCLGEIALEAGALPLARERIEAAQRIYEELASSLGRANCLKNLGRIALRTNDAASAVASFAAALDLFKLIGNRQGEADCLLGLGDLQREADPEAARARYKSALEIYTRIGDPLLIGRAHVRLSCVSAKQRERGQHIAAARDAWKLIGRSDLIAELESGGLPPDTPP